MSPQHTNDSHDEEVSRTTSQEFNATHAVDANDGDDSTANAEARTSASVATTPTTPKKANAFEKLMAASPSSHRAAKRLKLESKPASSQHHLTRPGRDGLGVYLQQPSTLGADILVSHNDSFVVIRDRFPKASVHLLVLPRTTRNTLHPLLAFQDGDLLATTRAEVEKVRLLVAEELRRLFGGSSAAERARREAIVSGATDVPPGREWEREVIAGVHAGPSMNHLHVHVLSRDMVSSCVKHRKHYNSFNTDFFVRLEELPLAEDDPRWKSDRGGGLKLELKCWRCGRGFENKFEKLKKHLAEEFEEWKTL